MPEKECDHTSVGMIVKRGDRILLIERKKPPFGFAPPAGHVDDKGSYEDAARQELEEEVGLTAKEMELLVEGKRDNPCRREGGTWHYWKVFQVVSDGAIVRSPDETKQADWFEPNVVMKLAERSKSFLAGNITQEDWEASPGIEPIWYDFFQELRIIDFS